MAIAGNMLAATAVSRPLLAKKELLLKVRAVLTRLLEEVAIKRNQNVRVLRTSWGE